MSRPLSLYFNPRAPYGARPCGELMRWAQRQDFNPRAPYGARPTRYWRDKQCEIISIHAPRTGRDSALWLIRSFPPLFQSTRPVRGATRPLLPLHRGVHISIHAPRTGRDERATVFKRPRLQFQSTRPVRGATVIRCTSCGMSGRFQSTRPVRGATLILHL